MDRAFPASPSRVWRAATAAVVVEALVLAGAAWLMARPAVAPSPAYQEIRIDLTTTANPLPQPPEPKPEPEPEPEPTKPEPPRPEPAKPQPVKHPPKPAPAKPHPTPSQARPEPIGGPVSDRPSDFAEKPVSPPPVEAPAPSPKPAAMTVDELFQARARAAVQNALRYPNAARMLKRTGQARVGFDYRDGRASNAHIVASSGSEALDDAAIDAVGRADLPPPPADLAGHKLQLIISVVFSVQS